MPFGLGALGVLDPVMVDGLDDGSATVSLEGVGGGIEEDGTAFVADVPLGIGGWVTSVGIEEVASFPFSFRFSFFAGRGFFGSLAASPSASSFSAPSDTSTPFAFAASSLSFFSFFLRFLI